MGSTVLEGLGGALGLPVGIDAAERAEADLLGTPGNIQAGGSIPAYESEVQDREAYLTRFEEERQRILGQVDINRASQLERNVVANAQLPGLAEAATPEGYARRIDQLSGDPAMQRILEREREQRQRGAAAQLSAGGLQRSGAAAKAGADATLTNEEFAMRTEQTLFDRGFSITQLHKDMPVANMMVPDTLQRDLSIADNLENRGMSKAQIELLKGQIRADASDTLMENILKIIGAGGDGGILDQIGGAIGGAFDDIFGDDGWLSGAVGDIVGDILGTGGGTGGGAGGGTDTGTGGGESAGQGDTGAGGDTGGESAGAGDTGGDLNTGGGGGGGGDGGGFNLPGLAELLEQLRREQEEAVGSGGGTGGGTGGADQEGDTYTANANGSMVNDRTGNIIPAPPGAQAGEQYYGDGDKVGTGGGAAPPPTGGGTSGGGGGGGGDSGGGGGGGEVPPPPPVELPPMGELAPIDPELEKAIKAPIEGIDSEADLNALKDKIARQGGTPTKADEDKFRAMLESSPELMEKFKQALAANAAKDKIPELDLEGVKGKTGDVTDPSFVEEKLAGGAFDLITGSLPGLGGSAGDLAKGIAEGVGDYTVGAGGAGTAPTIGESAKDIMGGLVNAGAGIVGGYVGAELGNMIGESLFGKQAESSYGATAGAIAGAYYGTALFPGVGTLIGAAVGAIIDVVGGGDGKERVTLGVEVSGRTSFGESNKDSTQGDSGLMYHTLVKKAGGKGTEAGKQLSQIMLGLDAGMTGAAAAIGVDIDMTGMTLAGGQSQAGKGGKDQAFFGSGKFNQVDKDDLNSATGDFAASWIAKASMQFPREMREDLQGLSGTVDEVINGYNKILDDYATKNGMTPPSEKAANKAAAAKATKPKGSGNAAIDKLSAKIKAQGGTPTAADQKAFAAELKKDPVAAANFARMVGAVKAKNKAAAAAKAAPVAAAKAAPSAADTRIAAAKASIASGQLPGFGGGGVKRNSRRRNR